MDRAGPTVCASARPPEGSARPACLVVWRVVRGRYSTQKTGSPPTRHHLLKAAPSLLIRSMADCCHARCWWRLPRSSLHSSRASGSTSSSWTFPAGSWTSSTQCFGSAPPTCRRHRRRCHRRRRAYPRCESGSSLACCCSAGSSLAETRCPRNRSPRRLPWWAAWSACPSGVRSALILTTTQPADRSRRRAARGEAARRRRAPARRRSP
eukprot:211489-Pleurochrysis_carterae.AAC.4